jgi:hypothetical protein
VHLWLQLAESEPKKFTAKVKVYLSDVWNVLDMVGIVLFFVGVITRFTWNPDYGHVWYTVSVTCFYSHIFDLYGVSKFLGTYITIVGKMVRTVHDAARLINTFTETGSNLICINLQCYPSPYLQHKVHH